MLETLQNQGTPKVRRFLLVSCFTLAGCAVMQGGQVIAPVGLPPVRLTDALEAAARMAVQQTLKDPGSAQFQPARWAFYDPTGGTIVCGAVNAKNSFGGYVGFAPYYALISQTGRPIYAQVQENTYVGQQVFMKLYPLCADR